MNEPSELVKKRVHSARVRILLNEGTGQGVLIPGALIVTAAHCVEWGTTGRMASGDYCLATVETNEGESFWLEVMAVEPVSDIAVLGMADDQEFPEHAEKFHRFVETTIALEIVESHYKPFAPFTSHIYAHKDTWLVATSHTYQENSPCFCTDVPIEGGTSGGPIVTEEGRLLGVAANASVGERNNAGSHPLIRQCLPHWIWRRVQGEL